MSTPMTPDAIKLAIQKLEKIVAWNAFPVTNHFWDKEKTQRMSFGAANGSNGERDYMRGIAKEALTLLKSLTADAGEAIKFIDKVRDSLHHQHTSQNGGPEINDRCLACEADRVLNPRQGVCGECGGKGGYPEGFGGSAHPIACGTCKGSGKAPTVSPGNSKDGWLSEKDILWWIEMFESGKALREKEPFAFERVAIPVLKMALTASSQEKRK